MRPHPEAVPWFIGTWIVLGAASVWMNVFDKDVARKKRLLTPFIVGTGVLFAGFTLMISGSLRLQLFLAPAVALITWLNLRMIKVCESCGSTVFNNVWFSKMEYCSKCGAKIP